MGTRHKMQMVSKGSKFVLGNRINGSRHRSAFIGSIVFTEDMLKKANKKTLEILKEEEEKERAIRKEIYSQLPINSIEIAREERNMERTSIRDKNLHAILHKKIDRTKKKKERESRKKFLELLG